LGNLGLLGKLRKQKKDKPVISTLLLSYNRKHLLKKTIESYLKTISVPFELIIIDNASTDGSKEYIEEVCKNCPEAFAIFLTKNFGGKSLNLGRFVAEGDYFHITENDIEYLDGWDKALLKKFDVFPKLGQLSLFSDPLGKKKEEALLKKFYVFPKLGQLSLLFSALLGKIKGEVGDGHPFTETISKEGMTIHRTYANVILTSIIPSKVFRKVLVMSGKSLLNNVILPADGELSYSIRKLGFWVAWNDKNYALNLGNSINEWIKNTDYYIENYQSKPIGVEGWKKRLQSWGYDLVMENGKYKIAKR